MQQKSTSRSENYRAVLADAGVAVFEAQQKPTSRPENYSDAILGQIAFAELIAGTPDTPYGAARISTFIRRATPVFWTKDCLPDNITVDENNRTTELMLPSEIGVIWFETNVTITPDSPSDAPSFPIRSILWLVPRDTRNIGILFFAGDPRKPNVPLAEVSFDLTTGRVLNEETPLVGHLVNLFGFCADFMSEQIHVTATPFRPNRAARKRAKHAAVHARDILVVQYRRPVTEHDNERSACTRQYSIQFPVAGHWRNQRVGPERSEIRRTWVQAHVKGPKNAPYVEKPRLLAVIR